MGLSYIRVKKELYSDFNSVIDGLVEFINVFNWG